MQDYKNNKILELKKEMVKVPNQTDYEINGIDTSRAIYFYRKEKEKFKIIPRGSYTIVDEASNKYLRITDSSLLGEALEFQVCYLFVKTSSSYIDDFPEIVLLQEHYNQLYEDFNNLLQQLQSNNILGDTLKMSYVLPQLNEGQVWVLREGEMVAEDIFDLDSRIKEAFETFKLLFSKWVDNTEKPRIDAYVDEKLQIASDEINSKTELEKIELEDYTEQKKNELDVYVSGRKPLQYGTIAELQVSSNLKINDFVEVAGYYTVGDGAGHKRIISVSDDGSGVQLANGLWANRIKKYACVVFTFDDNKPDDDTVYRLFKSKSIPCSFGVITDNVFLDTSNTLQNLYLYEQNGFEVLSHGSKHLRDIIDVELAKYEYESSRVALKKLGFEARGFIAPYSTVKQEVSYICENAYDYMLVGGNGIHYKHKIPSQKRITRTHLNSMTLQEKKNLIKKAMQEDLLIVFYAHQTDKGEDFEEFVNWIVTQNIKIKNASEGVYSFYPNFRESGDVKTSDSSFTILTTKENANNLSLSKEEGFIRVQDHNSIGVTVNGRSLRIPACNSGSTVTIQAEVGIQEMDTIRVLSSIKFGNSLSSKFKTTLECRLLKNDAPVKEFEILEVENSNYLFSNYIQNYTNNIRADKLLFIVRIVAKENTTTYVDVIVDEIKILSLKTKNTVTEEKKELPAIITDVTNYDKQGVSFVVDTVTGNPFILSNPATTYSAISYMLGYNRAKNRIVFRSYDTSTSTYREEIALAIESNTVSSLNTPYHVEKMKQEGVYNDFISYMDEKTAYDNQQREKEKAMQLAYEEALKENPNLTYEEFISTRPTTFSRRKRSLEIQEPVPSQALLEFKEKCLG